MKHTRTRWRWLWLAAPLLLAACATPRLPATPNEAAPERWQATLAAWWRQLRHSPTGGSASMIRCWPNSCATRRRTTRRCRKRWRGWPKRGPACAAAAAQRWPAVNASAQAQRGSSASSNFVASTQGSVGVDAQWEVDLFGATRAQIAAAQARSEQAALGWHAARVSLAADVAGTYVAYRACEAQQQVQDQDASSQTQTAELTREKVRVGFEAPANGALADGAAADSGNRAIAQRAECDVLIKSLVVLTGQGEPALRTRLQNNTAKLPQPGAFAVGTLPAQLLQQRPDIAAAERAIVAAAAEVGVAEAARYPRLTFSGNLGRSLLRVGGNNSDGTAWGFGPSLVLPIFDGGARRANEDAARARYEDARASLDGQLRRAVSEVEEALVRLDAATRREGQAQRAAQGFRDYFAAAEQRWRIGAGSLIDREDARRTALNAQNALINVQRERVAAWITLYRSLGGGWNSTDATPSQ